MNIYATACFPFYMFAENSDPEFRGSALGCFNFVCFPLEQLK